MGRDGRQGWRHRDVRHRKRSELVHCDIACHGLELAVSAMSGVGRAVVANLRSRNGRPLADVVALAVP
jgi:hypothetical protein